MQSEIFDKKIMEAADQHHPAYDENAWANMEKLLDEHLPQKKDDRRRIIFFLLLFLLAGGGAWLGVSKPWQRTTALTKVTKNDQQNISPTTTGTNSQTPVNTISSGKSDNVNTTITGTIARPSTILQTPPRQYARTTTNDAGNKRQQRPAGTSAFTVNQSPVKENEILLNENNRVQASDAIVKKEKSSYNDQLKNDNPATGSIAAENTVAAPQKQLTAGNNPDQKNITDPEKDPVNKDATDVSKTPAAKTTKNKRGNFFFLSFSAGPDISSAGTDQLGRTKLLTGAGLGYTIHHRFTIKTGFYVSRKVYSATPGEYHPPASFWSYYPDLQKVDADCKVYEIPLLFSYNFGNSTKQNWFATTGLSSYLMKRETYNYLYKNPAGQLASRNWTYNNEYKHYFSVLTLSGGYQRNLNKTLSIMVEPYLKVPLTGIGFGNVKLNSGGILFSVGIKPFAAKK